MTELDAARLHFNQDALIVLNALLALVIFGLALDIRARDFIQILKKPRPLVTGIVAQWLLMPAATALLIFLIEPPASLALGMLVVAACPGGAVSNYFSALAEANVALSVGLSAVSSLAAFAMTPFTISFWGHRLPATQALLRTVDVNFWQMFALVLLVLIMPTVLGILFARHRPVLADRIRRPFRLLSGSVFVLFIAGAFLANTSLFLTFFDRIAALVVVHNAVALLVGFVLAKLAHVGLPERKTITIETGIQNTALGLVLVFSFFEGLGGMALIAGFWGIWHLIAGGLLAIFFNQRGSYKTA